MKKIILIAVPVVAIVSAIALVKFFPSKKEVTKTPTPAKITTAPKSDATKDWKKYTNVEYSFSFLYPPVYTVEELADLAPDFLQVNLSKPGKTDVIVMVKGDYEPADVNSFVGFDPKETRKINGRDWYFFDFPQGYSNSPPFTTFQIENNNLYSFKFYNTISDEVRDQIMSTVTFSP